MVCIFLQVKSETCGGHRPYRVSLSAGGMPHCECRDWQRANLPCKHMFAIITQVDGYAWESLPDEYRQSPYFTLDDAVDNFVNDTDANIVEIEEVVDEGDTHYIPLSTRKSRLHTAAVICREKLQLLSNFTFLCRDEEVLEQLREKTEEALKFMRINVPVDEGLPLLNTKQDKTTNVRQSMPGSIHKRIPRRRKRPGKRRKKNNDSPLVSGGTSSILS